jgi:RimJ/RimL family protein N-acetyltransferase
MDFDLQPELVGERVRTRGLREDDFDALHAAASDPLIWEQHPADRHELDEFTKFFRKRLASGGALIVLDPATDEVIGSSSYYDLDPEHDEVAMGWTFLVRSRWDGATNAELKRLMLDHAFRYVESVLFWVDPTNIRSQRAMAKIGGVHEGQHDHAGHQMERFRIRRP